MKVKKTYMLLLLLLVSSLVLVGCSTETTSPEPANEVEPNGQSNSDDEVILTLEELSQYNGKDGNPAYIAIDGVVYDVTNVMPWDGGEHNGFTAGMDLTEEIKTKSPHGVSKLDGVPVVGKLAE